MFRGVLIVAWMTAYPEVILTKPWSFLPASLAPNFGRGIGQPRPRFTPPFHCRQRVAAAPTQSNPVRLIRRHQYACSFPKLVDRLCEIVIGWQGGVGSAALLKGYRLI